MSVKTIKLKGDIPYAKVPERIKEFREDCPRSSISHSEKAHEDGSWVIRCTIIKDKDDKSSMDSQGSSRYTAEQMKPSKAYEKLETISTGRALANLGYLNDGEVATTEEMEEYHSHLKQQKEDAIRDGIERIEDASTIDELKKVFTDLGVLIKESEIIAAKDKRKDKLNETS